VEGNTVVLKPSEDTPYSSQLCAEIYDEAGIPAGVFNVLHGDGETGDVLARGDVDHICFTGSAEVGQHIRKVAAESWHKTTSCEMGSKSAVIVFDDADLGLALDACVASSFKLSGQRCVSAGRILVHKDILQDFLEPFIERVKRLKTGNPFLVSEVTGGVLADNMDIDQADVGGDSGIDYGPIINEQGLEKITSYNELVFNDPEAHVKLKGEVLEGDGYFITPTVYVTEWRDVPYLKDEVFGPHVAIIPFENTEHAIHIYNDTDYGLAVGVVTNDFRKARTLRDELDAGMIYWNGGSIAAESHLSFGGVKKSGNGFPSAARTFRAVTHEVSWTVNHGESLSFPQGMK
jgi:aldehyde dehydrogenase (NAD+)